ncbi:MAG: ATP-binding protein [Anaerolineaceae bacterium]|nr:ATP-binding protein [Anaerolineaceae bacterium]
MSENKIPQNKNFEEPSMESNASNNQEEVRSLRDLLDLVTGKSTDVSVTQDDSGVAEILPFPFLALVGQIEMKMALLLSIVNPNIGGVLLIGPRGTGKTTAVRSLLDLLPDVEHSKCFYGCLPEDVEQGGMFAICPECAKRYAAGGDLAVMEKVRLVELPLNAKLEDVIGGIDARGVVHERQKLKRGILAYADKNVLFIDEVNILSNEIIDAILDAAASGMYFVRRGSLSANYRSRFTLIGSMNPEEGNLRPQIMDRFGLRVVIQGLSAPEERLEAYHRVRRYKRNPFQTITQYATETRLARSEIEAARKLLPNVILTDEIACLGINLIRQLEIDSLRAEITLFEAARAHAAVDSRSVVEINDLRAVLPMALRLRESDFMAKYMQDQNKEKRGLVDVMDNLIPEKE